MKAIGVDLGGHKVVVGVVEEGRIVKKLEEVTDISRKPEPVISQIVRMCRCLESDNSVPCGICIPGALDTHREYAMMITNFVGWNALPVRKMFEEAMMSPVFIENDANAYALGEGVAGVAKNVHNYVLLTLGTGIGGGVVLNDSLLTGAHGLAGELGHIVLGRDEPCGPGCRGFGHFEALCGADAMEKRAQEMGLGDQPDLKELWIRRKDPLVAPLWAFALDVIARGIASLIHIFDPEMVVIGGGLRKGQGFMETLTPLVPRYLGEPFKKNLCIRSSSLDTDAPIFGAACLAWKKKTERQNCR